MALLSQTPSGHILYAIAYEKKLESAGFLYLHAKDHGDAVNQILRSPVLKGCRIVGIAPAIGWNYTDPKTSREADRVVLEG